MAKLSGMSGDFKGREYPIEQGAITIGRQADNMILLDHPTISSHHCRILRNGDSCVLQDLDSTNGTRVNSRDVKECALHHKDLLQLGSIEFLFDAPELATSGARYTDANAEVATAAMSAPQDFASIDKMTALFADALSLFNPYSVMASDERESPVFLKDAIRIWVRRSGQGNHGVNDITEQVAEQAWESEEESA